MSCKRFNQTLTLRCNLTFMQFNLNSMIFFFLNRRHRCPHNDVSDHLEISHEPITSVTSYKEEYDEKHVDRQSKFYHEDHLRMEGEFIGERRTDFTVTRGERAPIVIPQDNLKPEGEFESKCAKVCLVEIF